MPDSGSFQRIGLQGGGDSAGPVGYAVQNHGVYRERAHAGSGYDIGSIQCFYETFFHSVRSLPEPAGASLLT